MARRRWVILALATLASGALAQERTTDVPRLSASDDLATQTAALTRALVGLPVADLAPTLAAMGARDAVVQDVAALGLPDGTELAPGLTSGAPIITAIFGLARGLFRPDLRLRIFLAHDGARLTGLLRVEPYAK
jgi:hypothetical protein